MIYSKAKKTSFYNWPSTDVSLISTTQHSSRATLRSNRCEKSTKNLIIWLRSIIIAKMDQWNQSFTLQLKRLSGWTLWKHQQNSKPTWWKRRQSSRPCTRTECGTLKRLTFTKENKTKSKPKAWVTVSWHSLAVKKLKTVTLTWDSTTRFNYLMQRPLNSLRWTKDIESVS